MRIGVIGGGIFGCTAAIAAAKAGHRVHLFEKSNLLLGAASGINQYRLHEGYHYPRSPETVEECQAGLESFRASYITAIITGGDRFYAIAGEGSHVSADDYLAFCLAHGLPFDVVEPLTDALDIMIQVKEARIDPMSLNTLIGNRLLRAQVNLHLNTAAMFSMRNEFDQIIIAAYAGSNDVAVQLRCEVEPLQFEVIEKPVIELPSEYQDFGVVIMDGPFCSIDPYGGTGLHVMGHVEHAIHATNIGLTPEAPDHLTPYMDGGVVQGPKHSYFDRFIEAGTQFMPFLDKAKHVGSMYTVRAVLPDRDATDERRTLVDRLDDQVIRIFSGKIGAACLAAEHAVQMLETSPHKMGDLAKAAA